MLRAANPDELFPREEEKPSDAPTPSRPRNLLPRRGGCLERISRPTFYCKCGPRFERKLALYAVALVPRNAGDMRCEGSPRFFLVSLLDALLLWLFRWITMTGWLFRLVLKGCGDRYIHRSYCRRRGGILRIRKDICVTNPTRKLLSGRRRISGHFDSKGVRSIASASAAVVDLQSMRSGRGCFRGSVVVVGVLRVGPHPLPVRARLGEQRTPAVDR